MSIQSLKIQLEFLCTFIMIWIAVIDWYRSLIDLRKLVLLAELGDLRKLIYLVLLNSIIEQLVILRINTSILIKLIVVVLI